MPFLFLGLACILGAFFIDKANTKVEQKIKKLADDKETLPVESNPDNQKLIQSTQSTPTPDAKETKTESSTQPEKSDTTAGGTTKL